MDSLYHYQVFDYLLNSDVALPELQLAGFHSDYPEGRLITFEMQTKEASDSPAIDWFHEWKTPTGATSIVCGRDNDTYFLKFPQIALFQLRPSSLTIVCFPYTTNFPIVRHMLLDQVIPRLLFHCGELVIHGSAVMAHDKCLIFLGSSGQGKSTLAIALCALGYPIISDDCLLLRVVNDKVVVLANYCGARLLTESVVHLVPGAGNQSGWGKARLDLAAEGYEYVSAVRDIRIQLFLLGAKDHIEGFDVSRLTGGGKAAEMLKHCFYLDTTDSRCHQEQFANLMNLLKTNNVTMFLLKYPRNYSKLSVVCQKIIEFSRKDLAGS